MRKEGRRERDRESKKEKEKNGEWGTQKLNKISLKKMLAFCFSTLKTANIDYLEIFALVQFLQLPNNSNIFKNTSTKAKESFMENKFINLFFILFACKILMN